MEGQNSEVARLLTQFEQEYQAAKQGFTGLAYGVSKHEFITSKMERMGQIHASLQGLVGEAAIQMIADQIAPLPDLPAQGETS